MSKYNTAKILPVESEDIIDSQDLVQLQDLFGVAPDTKNYEKSPAYKYSDKMDLATRALTSFMSEDKFYESAEKSDSEIIRLFEQVLKEDPEFAKGLLLSLRQDFHLRSVSHVLGAELARQRATDAADIIAELCERPDDMLEILAYYQKKYGNDKLPNSIKKGLAKAFAKFNEYQLAKYNKKDKVWLRDILRIAHPKPANPEQAELWGRVTTDTLKTPETWEVKISTEGSTKETWSEMIDSDKMGYMAILRNLRNFLKNDVPMAQVIKVANKLKDPNEVKKSKQLPFRFFSAYKALRAELGLGKPNKYDQINEGVHEENINICKAEVLFDALEEAAKISVQNLPKLDGKTVIACDVSGSMEESISEKSSVERFDIGLILGSLANGFSDDAKVGIFGDTWKEIEVDKNRPLASALEMHRREGEVGYSTNGYQVIKALLESRQKVDRVLFFTDCQMYGNDSGDQKERSDYYGGYQDNAEPETGKGIGQFICEYREQINADLKLYFFDLAGYGSCKVPEQDPQTLIVGGWSEKLFEFIPTFENGQNKTEFLDKLRKKYLEWKENKMGVNGQKVVLLTKEMAKKKKAA